MSSDSSGCPVEFAIKILGGKWKCHILQHLTAGPTRFGDLRRQIPGVSQRILTGKLRELEQHGVVFRRVFEEIPLKTEYSLTPLGMSLGPVLHALELWAQEYADVLDQINIDNT